PGFVTNSIVGRIDVEPRLALPLVLGGWSVRPEIGLRDTFYTQQLLPTATGVAVGTPSDGNINRRALDASLELRSPAVARVFDKGLFGRTLKHVIEPRVTYRFVNGIDNFQ